MEPILPKHQMSEEDIKLNYITPAIQSRGWSHNITMETRITDGKINLRGNMVVREKPKRADYILYLNANNPIAVVEAKDNKHTVSYGLQQAMDYAQKLDVPFAYSSNGDGFVEHDFLTGQERELALDEFPTQEELASRYKQGAHLTPQQEAVLEQPYYTSQNTYPPRYYQRIAINRTVDAIARGQQRLLLVMATGTGKTYTAFQIVYRMLESGMKRKILYLADRNILVDQSIQQDFAPLEKVTHKINVAKDDPSTITSHEVYFSLYQQLVGDDGKEHYSRLFSPDFFDLIIVDECHRGSAKEESRWRQVLEYFSSATQIGMTATPKETKYVSNLHYFGDPVFTYSLKEGIEDGFLAPFKVINITTDIGEGWRPRKGQLDVNGVEIPDRVYTNSDYDYNIIIQDRIDQVAREITKYLKSTDRMAKTIVFCATEDAAERMRMALVNLNADMVQQNPDYVVRITGSDEYGKKKLDYFISVSSPYPVIATTSKLLSTGADCKMTKLIVLDEMIGSMTEFKQIIGRGTRLREKEGKTHFVVMDFRNVTRLFADPDWDGPIQPYIDRYGQAWSKLEQFNSRFPEDMKKSLLQYAIQGKLVEQRPEEGTAEELFAQIQEEKQRLVAEKKIKKEKPLPEITEDEKPFDIPESWKWCRINQISYLTSGGQHQECESGVPYIKVADMNLPENKIEIRTSSRFVKCSESDLVYPSSIIFPKRGGAIATNKKRKVLSMPICIDSNTMAMSLFCKEIFNYVYVWFVSLDLGKLSTGTSVSQINNKDIEPLLIPLPPLAEQKRIVEKLEQLLPLCELLK